MDIKDSTALVTGGNRGIGEAFVRAFLAAGAAKVYVATRDPANAQHLVDEGAGKVVAIALDVTRPEQIEAAAAQCPDLPVRPYLRRRLEACAAGRLNAVVGHVDLLALPGV